MHNAFKRGAHIPHIPIFTLEAKFCTYNISRIILGINVALWCQLDDFSKSNTQFVLPNQVLGSILYKNQVFAVFSNVILEDFPGE